MKIRNNAAAPGAGAVHGVARGRGRRGEGAASRAAPGSPSGDVATVLGLSETELSPNVRTAIAKLLQEVDELRRELNLTRQRVAELERLADEDALLPVANRRAFVRELTRMMAFAERYATRGCVLYFDVNNMKAINDTHGHAAGDAALHRVAEMLMHNVRSSDIVGRLGGDEFGVIMAHTEPAAAREKANFLVGLIESEPMHWQGRVIPLSLAVGIHPFAGTDDPVDTLHAADRAMYRQKRPGNR